MDFARFQPDNYQGGEDCVHFTPKFNAARRDLAPFNDASCDLDDWAISVCQADQIHCYAGVECHGGYKNFYSTCYKVQNKTEGPYSAQIACVHEGAILMEPRSKSEVRALEYLLQLFSGGEAGFR